MTSDSATSFDATGVINSIDTSKLHRPDSTVLQARSKQRRRRQRIAGALSGAVVVGLIATFGFWQDTPSTSEVVAGSEDGVSTDSEVTESFTSTGEILDALGRSLTTVDGEPSLRARDDYFAATPDGEALYSGSENSKFFIARFLRWQQDDGSTAIELRLNNMSEWGTGQCGAERSGSLSESQGTIVFSMGSYPEVKDVDFTASDGVGCETVEPVALSTLFEQPFKIGKIVPEGFELTSADGTVTQFRRFDIDAPPSDPTLN